MAVTVQINGTALNPQPRETVWNVEIIGQKLNGTEEAGAYQVLTLRAPVSTGGTANWNWGDFDNTVLTSVTAPAPFDTMKGTAVTYSSGAIARAIRSNAAPPGGLVRGVEMDILVIV